MIKTDSIYSKPLQLIPKFEFNDHVVNVFDDMINRSVPGYQSILNIIEFLSKKYLVENQHVYDLGCSLGASSIAILNGAKNKNCHFFAIDSSKEMILKSRVNILNYYPNEHVYFINKSIQDVEYKNASFIVLNFTLQFIPINERDALLKRIKENMNSGGILILSEKIYFDDNLVNKQKILLHDKFKSENNYSDLEIKQKKIALKEVLYPEKIDSHLARLKRVGFKKIHHIFQSLNFSSMVIIND